MISKEEAELVGIILGDGYIYQKNNHYRFGFTGNPRTDKLYYHYLSELIYSVTGKKVKITLRSKGLRIVVNSKSYITRLTMFFELPFGKNKDRRIVIPDIIANDWNLAKHTIRGLVDTDGSVFTADKPGSPDYPTIELNTTSKALIIQLKKLLEEKGFRVTKAWSYRSVVSTTPLFKIALNGRQNIKKWLDEIGFSNPHKFAIALNAVTLQNHTALLSQRVQSRQPFYP